MPRDRQRASCYQNGDKANRVEADHPERFIDRHVEERHHGFVGAGKLDEQASLDVLGEGLAIDKEFLVTSGLIPRLNLTSQTLF